mmetsp:Transcript_21863/g.85660  ORF Transcript_21863/g.85660 Transcript_21863/m.85660 type:complete len:229 (+) Transcript_21863:3047-3733(+)
MGDDGRPQPGRAAVQQRVGEAGDDGGQPQGVGQHEDEGRQHDGLQAHGLRVDALEARVLDPAHQEAAPEQLLHDRHDQGGAGQAQGDQGPDRLAGGVQRHETGGGFAELHPGGVQPNPEREHDDADDDGPGGLARIGQVLARELAVVTPVPGQQAGDDQRLAAVDPAGVQPEAGRHIAAQRQQGHEDDKGQAAREGGRADRWRGVSRADGHGRCSLAGAGEGSSRPPP